MRYDVYHTCASSSLDISFAYVRFASDSQNALLLSTLFIRFLLNIFDIRQQIRPNLLPSRCHQIG